MSDTETMEVLPAATAEGPSLPTPYELGAMSTQTLRSELAQSLTMTARHLRRLAAVWSELERRGEDLTDLRTGLAVYLPQIAAGQLSADAVIRYAGQPMLLRSISTLPPAQQEALARGDAVEVLTVEQDGSYSSTRISAHALTGPQARLLIAPGRLRSVEEQRAQLDAVRITRAQAARAPTAQRVRHDAKTDSIRIGSARATVGEVVGAIARAAVAPAADGDLTSAVVTKLSEAEHKGLKIRAAQAGLTLQEYCRALLVMQSVL